MNHGRMQARIQEFTRQPGGGGGLKRSEKFWQARKKNKIKRRGFECGKGPQYLFCTSMVEILFSHWNGFPDNKKYDITRCFPHPQKHKWHDYIEHKSNCMIVYNVLLIIWGRGGGGFWGNIPQKIFGLNVVKACNFIRNMMETYFQESRDHKFKMYDDLG